jgi:hypothetical protein
VLSIGKNEDVIMSEIQPPIEGLSGMSASGVVPAESRKRRLSSDNKSEMV